MPARPVVIALALVGADFLAWRWASANEHDIVSLITGMALVPLVIALVWLLALAALGGLLRIGQGAHRRLRAAPAARRQQAQRVQPARRRRRPLRARPRRRGADRDDAGDRIAA